MGKQLKRLRRQKPQPSTAAKPAVEDFDGTDWRKGASVKAVNTWADVEKNTEDIFQDEREEVALEYDDDDEDENDRPEDLEVFKLRGVDSEDDTDGGRDFDDGEADRIDEEAVEKLRRKLNPSGQLSDDDEDTARSKMVVDEDDDDSAWGKKRRAFYLQEPEAADEEALKDEEREALRLQKKRLEKLSEEDFFETTRIPDSFANPAADETLSAFATDSAEQLDITARREAMEKMGPAALKAMVDARASDVVKMLNEMNMRWNEIETVLGPTLKWMRENASDKRPAYKYLQLRYRLLTTYVTNISFYLALRANPPNGRDVRYHPVLSVIERLAKVISTLETTVEGREPEPEEKTSKKRKKKGDQKNARKGFVNLLDQIADVVEEAAEEAEEIGEDDGDDQTLVGTIGEAEDVELSAAESRDDAELPPEEGSSMSLKKEKKAAKTAAKTAKKAAARESAGRALSELDEIVIPDLPDVMSIEAKVTNRRMSNILDDFGEVDENEADMEDKRRGRKNLKFHVIAKRARKNDSIHGDTDIPLRDSQGKLIESQSSGIPDRTDLPDTSALDDIDPEEELGFNVDFEEEPYNEAEEPTVVPTKREAVKKIAKNDPALKYYDSLVAAEKTEKKLRTAALKEAKEARKRERKETMSIETMESEYEENDLSGLTPRRKKIDRNPRVKKRLKYEKAKIKLRSIKAIPVDKAKAGAYRGEMTGIRRDLSKSVRFA
ncbi:hypothetical protein DFJ73DRAFT_807785 [Zopfochytrium polystomum]|nr:hypothetical protein DFJ73DRAFT_807785 [Zopfochytrium polystomum]